MQVVISVISRFWAFNLAQQLLQRNSLQKIITSYPKFEAAKYGIPREKVSSLFPIEVFVRGWSHSPSFMSRPYDPQYLLSDLFDRWAGMRLTAGDVLVSWAGYALQTIRKAKQAGMKTIVERGSSHVLYQMDILREEYERHGLRLERSHPRMIEKMLQEYDEADYISIPSLFVKRTFLARGVPERKLVHVPYGVDLSQFKQVPKRDKTFRIIHCGGINLRKGVHYLLQAFSELDLPDSELWLIGRLDDEIRPFLKKFGNDRVIHKGPYRQSELYQYYSQGSVFALMSIEEGLAMVQLQAMACGLPVIVSENTGARDIIRHGQDGFVLPIRDVEALKETISLLYKNEILRRALGQSARARAVEFTWDRYGAEMVHAYQRVLSVGSEVALAAT